MKQTSHYQEILRVVSRIGRLTNPQHLPVLKKLRISLAQFLVLDALDDQERPLRMTDLAEAAGLTASELTRVVDELLGKRWIAREIDAEDSRARLIKRTRAGEALMARARRQAGVELLGVWSDFTHEEWHRFIDYLHRFAKGLARAHSQARAPARGRGARRERSLR